MYFLMFFIKNVLFFENTIMGSKVETMDSAVSDICNTPTSLSDFAGLVTSTCVTAQAKTCCARVFMSNTGTQPVIGLSHNSYSGMLRTTIISHENYLMSYYSFTGTCIKHFILENNCRLCSAEGNSHCSKG